MSQPAPDAPSRARSRILIAVGAALIAATYLYVVLSRPTEMELGRFGAASLIALGGYAAGALVIVAGAIRALPTRTLVLIPVAIAVNIAVGQLTAAVGLPLYLDSIGTILVAVLAGPAAGAATGALGNVVWGLFNPFALPFAVTSVVVGALAGLAARAGAFRRLYIPPLAGIVVGAVAAVVSAPVAAFIYGGVTAPGTGALVAAFEAMGHQLLVATTLQGLVSDSLDKAITFTLVFLALAALPAAFRQQFPFVRDHRVLGAPGGTPRAPLPPSGPKGPTGDGPDVRPPGEVGPPPARP